MMTKLNIAYPASARARLAKWIAPWIVTALLAGGLQPGAAQTQQHGPIAPNQHYEIARAAAVSGNLDGAILDAKLAIQEKPLDAESHFLLGCLLERKGESDQAAVGFQKALMLDPTNPKALYNLGTMLLRRGEAVPASRLFEDAILVSPNYVPNYNNLGKAYFLAGLPELAIAAWEEVLRRDPSNPIALKNLLLMAESSGFREAAASYSKRLDMLGSSRSRKSSAEAKEQLSPRPVWPVIASLAASQPPAKEEATQAQAVDKGKKEAKRDEKDEKDEELNNLREVIRDLANVKVERRGERLTLTGWTTSPKEKEMLGRILDSSDGVLNLTSDDIGDTHRMIEVDAIIFVQFKIDQTSVGFNFLQLVQTNFSYFASHHNREGTGYTAPGTIGAVTALAQQGWLFSAAVDYSVNIANASRDQVAVIARPHLTTLSGTPAKFQAGGELVFKVSGINSGDIRPYPYGTTISVTPTLLRTLGEDGNPRVHVMIDAGRTSVLGLLTAAAALKDDVNFDKISVTSQAILGMDQTLILSGLNQRESRIGRSGIPGLMYIPLLKYVFSTKSVLQSDSAIIIFLTPRDPAYMDERNRKSQLDFVETRRAFLQARHGTEEDMRRFRERYPDGEKIAPNRFASHFFLLNNSEIYRSVSGQRFASDVPDLELLGKAPKK